MPFVKCLSGFAEVPYQVPPWSLPVAPSRSRFLGRGCDEALFSEKKGVFSEKGGGNSVNEGFGKDFYRKGNSVKRFGPFTEPPDSENRKVAVLIPFPKISSYQECPKINPKKRTWYQPRRHVCILRFLLRSASQGVHRDRTKDSPFPPESAFKTYLVPGWTARLSARHVWIMQNPGFSRGFRRFRGFRRSSTRLLGLAV